MRRARGPSRAFLANLPNDESEDDESVSSSELSDLEDADDEISDDEYSNDSVKREFKKEYAEARTVLPERPKRAQQTPEKAHAAEFGTRSARRARKVVDYRETIIKNETFRSDSFSSKVSQDRNPPHAQY